MITLILPQIVLAVYFQVVEWVPLFPWNDLAAGNPQQPFDIAIGAVQLALIIWTARQNLWFLRLALSLYGLWSVVQVLSWWIPYFFGAPPEVQEAYRQFFGRTHKFLPPIAEHPIPDSNHVVLQLLLCWVLVRAFVALRKAGTAKPAPSL